MDKRPGNLIGAVVLIFIQVVLNVLGGLFALVMGVPTAVVGIVIAAIVLAMVFGRQTSDWLSVR